MTEIYEGDKKIGEFCGGLIMKPIAPLTERELERLKEKEDTQTETLKTRYESKEE